MSHGRLIDRKTRDELVRHPCYSRLCTALGDAYGGAWEDLARLMQGAGIPSAEILAARPVAEMLPPALSVALDRGILGRLIDSILEDSKRTIHHPLIRVLAKVDVASKLEAYVKQVEQDLSADRRVLDGKHVDLDYQVYRSQEGQHEPTKRSVWDDEVGYAGVVDKCPDVDGQNEGVRGPRSEIGDTVRERLGTVERCVLLGESGSGKTWTLARHALDLCKTWLRASEEERPSLLVPIWAPLRRYSGMSREQQEKPLSDFVWEQLGKDLAPLGSEPQLRGPVVVLLDGLNELPNDRDTRDNVCEGLSRLDRFVLSCRVRDFEGAFRSINSVAGLVRLHLMDLDPPKIWRLIWLQFQDDRADRLWEGLGGGDALLRSWHLVSSRGHLLQDRYWLPDGLTRADFVTLDHVGEELGCDLDAYQAWKAMFHGTRSIYLFRSPLLLTTLCKYYADHRGLPASRYELLEKMTAAQLSHESKQANSVGNPWSSDTMTNVVAVLMELARVMLERETTVIDYLEAERCISQEDAATLLRAALDARLLIQDGEQVAFEHQQIQKYFAARPLLQALEGRQLPDAFFQDGTGWWDPHKWRNIWPILGETLGGTTNEHVRVANWLAHASPEVALDVLGYSMVNVDNDGTALETLRLLISSANSKITEQHPCGRAAAYRVLGKLNADTRKGVGVLTRCPAALQLPDIYWATVPEGEFHYQRDESADRIVTLRTFKIARYPVTWAQFQVFVTDPGGYGRLEWWDELDKRLEEPLEACWPIADHPRETVDWYEAVAYTRWLTSRLHRAGTLPRQTVVRLPTEEEWERAACGTERYDYPWGNDYHRGNANTQEPAHEVNDLSPLSLNRTSAVGIYLDDATPRPRSVYDLAGNVREWCLDAVESQELDEGASSPRRAVRGGSWFDSPEVARLVYRDSARPDERASYLGFRLVTAYPVVF